MNAGMYSGDSGATIRVGYGSMESNFSAPGDRRRFAGFAIRNGLNISRIQDRLEGNDVVLLTLGSDLSVWKSLKKKNGAVIIDLVDAYLDEQFWSLRRLFRGSYKSATRQLKNPVLNYTKMLRNALAGVDAVMCASPEQKESILEYNPNVFVTVDCLEELFCDTSNEVKSRSRLNLLWEGFPENLQHFDSITGELVKLARSYELTLTVLTDLSGVRRGSLASLMRFKKLLANINVSVQLVPWSVSNLIYYASRCDFGIIPIDQRNTMAWLKSENKLLSFWAMGLPTLTSPTPSYSRVMSEVSGNNNMANVIHWTDCVSELYEKQQSLDEYSARVCQFARSRSSEAATDVTWMKLLSSVI